MATTFTSFTTSTLRAAAELGYRPITAERGGRVVVALSQPGIDGTFGALYIGPRTGVITGAVLYQGNSNAAHPHRFHGAQASARAIRALSRTR